MVSSQLGCITKQIQDRVVGQAIGRALGDGESIKANLDGGLVLIAFRIGDGQGDRRGFLG